MAKTTCKLCSRHFSNPRALAGHMRSHSINAGAAAAAAAAAVAAAAAAKQQIPSASSESGSFTTADEYVGLKRLASVDTLLESPKPKVRLADGSYSDRESEVESTPPRAKRSSPAAAWGEAEAVSSLSEAATPEEDVALSLMKLSRDSWPSGTRFEVYSSDDGSDEGSAPPPPPPPPTRPRPRPRPAAPVAEKKTTFPCTACNKVFRSYQALGGHRASNVRGGRGGCGAIPVAASPQQPLPLSPLPEQQQQEHGDEHVDAKHECPHCSRVFNSGQALGGHKRSHVCGAAAAVAAAAQHGGASTSSSGAAAPPSPTKMLPMIDLNAEPPSEEVELSAV